MSKPIPADLIRYRRFAIVFAVVGVVLVVAAVNASTGWTALLLSLVAALYLGVSAIMCRTVARLIRSATASIADDDITDGVDR